MCMLCAYVTSLFSEKEKMVGSERRRQRQLKTNLQLYRRVNYNIELVWLRRKQGRHKTGIEWRSEVFRDIHLIHFIHAWLWLWLCYWQAKVIVTRVWQSKIVIWYNVVLSAGKRACNRQGSAKAKVHRGQSKKLMRAL